MRQLIGVGTPRGLQGRLVAVLTGLLTLIGTLRELLRLGLDENWYGTRTLEHSDLKALLHEGNHFGG